MANFGSCLALGMVVSFGIAGYQKIAQPTTTSVQDRYIEQMALDISAHCHHAVSADRYDACYNATAKISAAIGNTNWITGRN